MLPTLTLAFPSTAGKTVAVELPATESYLLQQDDTRGDAYYCSGIEPAAGSPTIVGANTLHTLLTVFDREHGQIGFAPQLGCTSLGGTTLFLAALAPGDACTGAGDTTGSALPAPPRMTVPRPFFQAPFGATAGRPRTSPADS
jgi:hypothetical protein